MTLISPRHGIVMRDGNYGEIRFERALNHPVEDVWEALTTPAGLAAWWLPFPAEISIDLVVGGAISFAAPELGEAPLSCAILEVEAPYRLVHSHFDRAVTLAWHLQPVDDGCVLRLTQTTPDIAAALGAGQVVGLHQSLDRLAPALAGAPQPWDWDRFAQLEAEYRARLLSPRQQVVERYFEGFRTGEHTVVLDCLTDDVTWDIVGHTIASGRAEFEALIDGPAGASLPRLTISRHIEEAGVVATVGAGEFDDAVGLRHAFRFADTFAFRDDRISAVVSYVVPLPVDG